MLTAQRRRRRHRIGEGDRFPVSLRGGHPFGGTQDGWLAGREDLDGDEDHPPAAVEVDAEARASGIGARHRTEVRVDAARKGESGIDLIARDHPDGFGGGAGVGWVHVGSILGHVGVAGRGISREETEEIHDVRAEGHQVLPAGSRILLAPAAQFEQGADFAGFHHAGGVPDVGRSVHHVGQLDLDPVSGRRGDDAVGIGEVARHRLFHEDVRTGAGDGFDHLHALVRPTGTDADEVWLFLAQHLAVVRVDARRAGAFGRFRGAFGHRVGNGEDFGAGDGLPDEVDAMSVIAMPGVADHAHAPFPRGGAGESLRG